MEHVTVIRRLLLIVLLNSLLVYSQGVSANTMSNQRAELKLRLQQSTHADSILKYQLQIAKIDLQTKELNVASKQVQKLRILESKIQTSTIENRVLYFMVLGLEAFEKEKYQSAKTYYQGAIDLIEKTNEEKRKLLELNNDLGRIYIVTNDLSKAKTLYANLLKYIHTMNPRQIDSMELSNTYNNLGVISFYEGELDQAYAYYDQSRTIASQAGQPQSANVGRAYYNMGLVREEKDYLVDAEIFYKRALKIYQSNFGTYHYHIAEVNGSLGNIALRRYELQKATYYFRKDLEISTHLYGNQSIETTWGLENLGRVYQIEHQDSLARNLFQKALQIREKVYGQNHIYISNLLLSLAEIEKQNTRAIALAQKARSIERKITSKATIGKWNISLFLLKRHIQDKQYALAQEELKRAMTIGEQIAPTHHNSLFSKTYLLAAQLYNQKGEQIQTERYIKKAMNACLVENVQSTPNRQFRPDEIRLVPEYLEVITQQAEMATQTGRVNSLEQLRQVATNLNSVIEVIKMHQKRRTSDDEDKEFSKIYRKLYEQGLIIHTLLWEKTGEMAQLYRAFNFAERIKDNGLLDMLHRMDSHPMANLPNTTLRKEYQLKKEILYYQSMLDDKEQQRKIQANKKLFELYREEKNFYQNLEEKHPDYYQAKYNFDPITIKSIQKRIKKDDEIIWHSTWVDGTEYLFLVDKKNVKLYQLKHSDHAGIIRQILDKGFHQWIVIPDFSVAWEDLEAQKMNGHYLIEQCSFIYNSSASNYFTTAKNSKLINSKILAFAPIYFENERLKNLLYSQDEIEKIKKYFNVTSFENRHATKQQFFKNMLSYGILHLSTHVSYNVHNPIKSKLFLAPLNNQDDGILYAYDIFGTPMRTHLVTLSACDSKKAQTETNGLAGIADAFSYNGCRNILMTLWQVEDKAMMTITVNFYKYLSKGYPKEVAIQKAKIDYLRHADRYKSDPFYWSGIILQGDSIDLGLESSFFIRYWKEIAFLLFVVLAVAVRKL